MAAPILRYSSCFICTKQVITDGRPDFSKSENVNIVNSMNAFVLKNILDLPLEHDTNCPPDLSQMNYCKICSNEIFNIQATLGRLEKLEKQLLDMKYGLETKLTESWKKSKETQEGSMRETSHPAGEIRQQVAEELCKNTMLTILGKIQTNQMGKHLRLKPSFRIMQSVTISDPIPASAMSNSTFKPEPSCSSAVPILASSVSNITKSNYSIPTPISNVSNITNSNPKTLASISTGSRRPRPIIVSSTSTKLSNIKPGNSVKAKNVPQPSDSRKRSSLRNSTSKKRKSYNESETTSDSSDSEYEPKPKAKPKPKNQIKSASGSGSGNSSSASRDADSDVIMLMPEVKVEVLGDNEEFGMNYSPESPINLNLANAGQGDAVPGDVLVLTKPLGTKIAVTVLQWLDIPEQWTRLHCILNEDDARKAYLRGMDTMNRLNGNAVGLMMKHKAHASTQLNELGLLSQANDMARNQKTGVSFVIHNIPVIAKMGSVDKCCGDLFNLRQGLSPEPSGGLLISFSRESAALYCRELEQMEGYPAWIIGIVEPGPGNARIIEKPRIIEVPAKETESIW